MTRVVVTEPANADLETITHHLTVKARKAVASRYVDDFEALWEHFVRFPSSGAPRFKFGKGIRSGYVRPYVLYYRYDGAHDIGYVLRILHGKRDISRALFRARGQTGRKE
jgi:toxin ParE1/3/4